LRWELLDALPAEVARAVLDVVRRSSYERNDPICREGEHGDCMYLLETGKVAVRVTTPMGDVATLRILSAGDFFGELALISPGRRNATVTALEPVTVLALHRAQLATMRSKHVAVEAVLIEALVAEVRRLSRSLLQAMYVPLAKRVADCLVDLADIYATDPGPVTIPLTQDDIAGLCGAARPPTNQVLKGLEAAGLVKLARGRVVVLDQAGLLEAARVD
jgi:CRP-like cAMP-binding protein